MSGGEAPDGARAGDVAAFVERSAPIRRRAYKLAVRLCGDEDLAAEACIQALTRAFLSPGRLGQGYALSTWILHLVHEACLAALGWQDRSNRSGGHAPTDASSAIPGSLLRLPPDLRSAVVLRDVLGLPESDAAAVAGVEIAVLRRRLYRGRAALAGVLRVEPGGSGRLGL